MPFALDGEGRPLFLISTMAMHTQNLQQDPRASLLVTQPEASGDPLGAARVTVVGNASVLAAPEVEEARRLYLERHPNSKYWVDFDDFSFFRYGRGRCLLRRRLRRDGMDRCAGL